MSLRLYHADSLTVLPSLEENSIDAVVTDPPYELTSIQKRFGKEGSAVAKWQPYQRVSGGFMGKQWDATGIQRDPAFWAEVLRVMKPGSHLLAFGGTRTYHRMACAIEDAGFEIRDMICWHYGEGFPKSLDVSKAMDKKAGIARADGIAGGHIGISKAGGDNSNENEIGNDVKHVIGKGAFTRGTPATPEAEQWNGWGTALKPATEPICLARKPLSESSVAANVLRWGTGALNIDAGRIATSDRWQASGVQSPAGTVDSASGSLNVSVSTTHEQGRWPANVIFDEHMAEELDRQSGYSESSGRARCTNARPVQVAKGAEGDRVSYGHEDAGGAARFFYIAKASPGERHVAGTNAHPTVKPVALMVYLVSLVCPPGGTVLDPFAGSGTTGIACARKGFSFVGIEQDGKYVRIAQARIEADQPLFNHVEVIGKLPPPPASDRAAMGGTIPDEQKSSVGRSACEYGRGACQTTDFGAARQDVHTRNDHY